MPERLPRAPEDLEAERLVFDSSGVQRQGRQLDRCPLLGPHRARIVHTADHVRREGESLRIALYHWHGEALWLQSAHFEREGDDVIVALEPARPHAQVPLEPWLLQSILDHAGDVILVTEAWPLDPPGPRVVHVNEAFTRHTGYAARDIIGRTPRILQGEATEPDAVERMGRALRAWRPVRVEVTNYRRDGRPFLVDLDIRPIPDQTGWITHWVSVQRDVTMRRAAEAQELESDRIQTISLLAGGIAHDFNNLLVGVAGNLELARESLHAPEEVRELLFEAEQASQQARNLTRQLRDMSKDAEPRRTHFALSAVLRQAAGFACRGSSVQTKAEFPTDHPHLQVHADWGQLTQLFTNLALNAVEAMEGSGQLTLRVRIADSGSIPVELDSSREWVVAELEDSGPGLSGLDVKQLFRPYFSTKARGSGIGLTICWMVAHRHGGHVDMQSTPDGAKVRVFLPRSKEHVNGCPEITGSVESTMGLPTREGARPSSGLRVLWMDDDEMVRNVATRIARRFGWQLTLASRGEEVLDLLGSDPEAVADVVLLDLTVKGGLGGKETLDAIRKVSHELPVLLASGYVTAGEAGDAEGMARVRRIAKPFRIRELREAVDALTGNEREVLSPPSTGGSRGGG